MTSEQRGDTATSESTREPYYQAPDTYKPKRDYPDWRDIDDAEERRKQRRLAKNRATAARSRDRKRSEAETLQSQIQQLTTGNQKLQDQLEAEQAHSSSIQETLAQQQHQLQVQEMELNQYRADLSTLKVQLDALQASFSSFQAPQPAPSHTPCQSTLAWSPPQSLESASIEKPAELHANPPYSYSPYALSMAYILLNWLLQTTFQTSYQTTCSVWTCLRIRYGIQRKLQDKLTSRLKRAHLPMAEDERHGMALLAICLQCQQKRHPWKRFQKDP